MAARLRGIPVWQFFTDTGAVLAGGTVEFLVPGTSTLKTVWKDVGKAATGDNPITLDAAGRLPYALFFEDLYDINVKDSGGVNVPGYTVKSWGDNYSTPSVSGAVACFPANGSFETDEDADSIPDNWTRSGSQATSITRGTTGADTIHGSAYAVFTSVNSNNALLDSAFAEISPNHSYLGSVEYKTSNAACRPQILLLFYDSAQAFISSVTLFVPSTSSTSWTKEQLQVNAAIIPATARFCKIRVNGNTAASAYTSYFDNLRLCPLNSLDETIAQSPSGLRYAIGDGIGGGDTSHDITVFPGAVLDSLGTYLLIFPTKLTKQIDATWAQGDNQGGGSSTFVIPTDGIFAIYLIGKPTTGETEIIFDTAWGGPTLPAGWTKFRRIGAVTTDSAQNLENFVFVGNRHTVYANMPAEWTDATVVDNTPTTRTLDVPPWAIAHFTMRFEEQGGPPTPATEAVLVVRPKNALWPITGNQVGQGFELTSATLDELWMYGDVQTDGSSQIETGVDVTGVTAGNIYMEQRVLAWDDVGREQII